MGAVADGHWNNRVVKFDKEGRYLLEWVAKVLASLTCLTPS